jgi:hypothetical protein
MLHKGTDFPENLYCGREKTFGWRRRAFKSTKHGMENNRISSVIVTGNTNDFSFSQFRGIRIQTPRILLAFQEAPQA